jgi:dCTP deaminase
MLQPGFRGCPSLELFNHGNNPVEIVVGSRVVQARFVDVGESRPYGGGARKYFGDVRPTLSRIGTDADFAVLDRMKQLSSV